MALRQTEAVRQLLKDKNIEQLIDDDVLDINRSMGMIAECEIPLGSFRSCIGLNDERKGISYEQHIEVSIVLKVKRRKS